MKIISKDKFILSMIIMLLFVVSLVLIILGTLDQINNLDTINEVDCYDRYSNKIVGQTCETEYITPYFGIGFITIFITAWLILFNTSDSTTNFFGGKK